MVVSATIERHEVAPISDFEWDSALKHYGNDRPSRGDAAHPRILHCGCPTSAYTDNCDRLDLRRSTSDFGRAPRPGLSATHPYAQPLMDHRSSSSSVRSVSSPENTNPLIHEVASLEDDLSSFSSLSLDQATTKSPTPVRWRRHRSQSRDLVENLEFADLPPLDLTLTRCRSQPGRERAPSVGASEPSSAVPMAKSPSTTTLRQALTLEEKDAVMRRAAHPARRQQCQHSRLASFPRTPGPALNYPYPVPERDGLPRPINVDEDPGHLCMGAERLRLRGIYEDEGWLPAPNPSQATRLARATAIRRLGLTGSDDDERYAVIAKYAETAAMIFQAKYGFVCVLRGDIEEVYLPNYKQHKITFPLSSSLIAHAVLTPSEKCFVVADLDKDWRFARHPARIGERKTRFMAAAPLRYFHSGGDYSDFGSLVVFDPEPRDNFDEREQSILLRLANMCVFQLATLQSERMAKRSSGMYEASIGFLRRSLVPDVNDNHSDTIKSPTERTSESKRTRRRPPEKRGSTQSHRRHSTPPPGPIVSQRPSLSGRTSPREVSTGEPLETKSGPRDAYKLKRHSEPETAMFADACTTLRGVLGADAACIVDLSDYQLFVRKTRGSTAGTEVATGAAGGSPGSTKENIIHSFLSGEPWADATEPVVNARRSSVSVLGSSGSGFAFESPGASTTLADYVSAYLRHRRFWWDLEDASDSLASQLLLLMPYGTQTVLANVFLTYNGTLQFAAFVAWDRAPASFDDTSRLAMPFVYIVGAALVSSMAVVRMRGIEESQISYSNLQAHELRTPLHQILAITQLLRSSMRDMAAADEGAGVAIHPGPGATVDPALSWPAHHLPERVVTSTLQQVRDLLPFLDAIDTSGKILHGIVDNILTFLDLTDKDERAGGAGGELKSLGGNGGRTPLTIGALLEELIRDAYEADKLSRSSLEGGAAAGDATPSTPVRGVTKSTIFEIIPSGLGDAVMEDEGGALRRALQRILANAYRYLDDGGCVEVYLDDVHSLLPPEGCEPLQPAERRISLKIIDSGRGMSTDFVKERLGEPWAKEDPYATGSGLSVHLAYRIIELMGGYMEISSAPGKGCSVSIEVPLPATQLPAPAPALVLPDEPRRIAAQGFTRFHDPHCALKRIGAMLERTYRKLGHGIVADPNDADLVVVEATLALTPEGTAMLSSLSADLVLFVGEDAAPFANTIALLSQVPPGRTVKVLKEPLTPAAIAHSAASAAAELTPVPEVVAEDAWQPKNVAESIAALCLGDYFSSRRSARPPPPTATSSSVLSSTRGSSASGSAATLSTPPSSHSSPSPATRYLVPEYSPLYEGDEDPALPPPCEVTSVLVVEDNVINRKILVKILRQALGKECELAEATDGKVALEMFCDLSRRRPIIVLLDINMPVLDGWATASEMRAIEREREKQRVGVGRKRRPSKIFAVTALAGQNEKRRGLVECGFDGWLTKPCDRDTLCRVVEGARRELQGLAP